MMAWDNRGKLVCTSAVPNALVQVPAGTSYMRSEILKKYSAGSSRFDKSKDPFHNVYEQEIANHDPLFTPDAVIAQFTEWKRTYAANYSSPSIGAADRFSRI